MAILLEIEGIDGSGKGTQAKLLKDHLQRVGWRAEVFAFPTYQQTFFGREVARYLNGEYGGLDEVDPKLVAMLYAGDRFEHRLHIQQLSKSADVVIFDRYMWSNVAHQAAKLPSSQWEEFTRWIEELELSVFGLPRPDRVILLDMPPVQATVFVGKKAPRAYTAMTHDLHEAKLEYQERVSEVYQHLSIANGWIQIQCADVGGLVRSAESIHNEIWAELKRDGTLS